MPILAGEESAHKCSREETSKNILQKRRKGKGSVKWWSCQSGQFCMKTKEEEDWEKMIVFKCEKVFADLLGLAFIWWWNANQIAGA